MESASEKLIQIIENLLDEKLKPIKRDLTSIRTSVRNRILCHVESANEPRMIEGNDLKKIIAIERAVVTNQGQDGLLKEFDENKDFIN